MKELSCVPHELVTSMNIHCVGYTNANQSSWSCVLYDQTVKYSISLVLYSVLYLFIYMESWFILMKFNCYYWDSSTNRMAICQQGNTRYRRRVRHVWGCSAKNNQRGNSRYNNSFIITILHLSHASSKVEIFEE